MLWLSLEEAGRAWQHAHITAAQILAANTAQELQRMVLS